MVKVTVVVPVYNPGPFIEPGIESMLHQTLAPDELEVLFVDDGSTDETPARLDNLAAAHSNIRVIHTPNSGWAGRPRNIGIREAAGEFVQFMDQDDSMTPDALRLLYEMATRNHSDIVIGKVASNFRPVPQHLFRRNIDACTIHDAPLISSLTPHKMFRTSFLRENGIEFPEGKRRLEDQLFMVRAYLVAQTVSILSDTVCYNYARRADGGNAGHGSADPALYFGNLREILEVVVASTEPGAFRTGLLSRFYRTGMVDRLSEPYFLARSEPDRQAIYSEIHALAQDFADDDLHATMDTFRRVRSALLRADRLPALVLLAERLLPLRADALLEDVRWEEGRLRIEFRASLVFRPDGRPLEALRREGRAFVDPALLDGVLDGPFTIDEPPPWGHLDCFLRERSSGAEWRVPRKVQVRMVRAGMSGDAERLHPVFRAVATIDVDRIAGGHPLGPGDWELRARVFGPGIDRRTSIGSVVSARPLPAAMISRGGGPSAVAIVEEHRVVLRIGHGRTGSGRGADAAAPVTTASWVELPLHADAAAGDLAVSARRRASVVRLVGRVDAADGLMALVIPSDRIIGTSGTWRLTARPDGPQSAERLIGTVEVCDPDLQLRAGDAGPRIALDGRLRRLARRFGRSTSRRSRLALRRLIPDVLARWL